MSLVCTETREYITFGLPLFCACPRDAAFVCALSHMIVDRIPMAERRSEPCATPADGVDIYMATSSESHRGAYTWSGLKKSSFQFSLSVAAAQRYVPRVWAEYQPGHMPKLLRVNVSVHMLDPPTGKPN